jgi:hypothetical protein
LLHLQACNAVTNHVPAIETKIYDSKERDTEFEIFSAGVNYVLWGSFIGTVVKVSVNELILPSFVTSFGVCRDNPIIYIINSEDTNHVPRNDNCEELQNFELETLR